MCERRAAMTWMERLKRVFDIDLKLCESCGKYGHVRVVSCIEDPYLINKILTHLKEQEQAAVDEDGPQLSLFSTSTDPPIKSRPPCHSGLAPESLEDLLEHPLLKKGSQLFD